MDSLMLMFWKISTGNTYFCSAWGPPCYNTQYEFLMSKNGANLHELNGSKYCTNSQGEKMARAPKKAQKMK